MKFRSLKGTCTLADSLCLLRGFRHGSLEAEELFL
jgi:hypothetical protein